MPLSILATSANVALTDITDKHPGDTVTVSGTSSYNEVIIKVIRPNTTVSYYDVAFPSNGIYSKSFTLPTDADLGRYTVIAGKDTDVATDAFVVTTATTASSNAKLKTLQVSEGSLVFSADQTDYSVSVGNSVSVVTITAAADDTNATVKINSETTISKAITLNVGPNTVPIEVTAQDGVTQKTYNLTIKRAAAETAASGATISVTTEPVTITVGSGITDAKISVPISSDGTATLPFVEVMAASTSLGGNVSVSIPDGTVVTAPDNWDGKIKLPEVQSNSSVTINNANVNSVIEIGSPSVTLTFNKAVRLLVPSQAGKSAGYVRSGLFHAITTTLGADNQKAADALPVGGEAKIDVGSDLVIWTKHFTQFVSYTAVTPTPTPVPAGGGGGGAVSMNTDIIYAASGGTVTLNGAKIVVPAGAVNGNISNFKVTVNKVTDTSILPIDSSSKLISDVFDISKDITGEFTKPVQITLPFDKNSVDMGLSTVSIYWFNEDTKKWIQLDNPQVDSDNTTVTGSVNHFTKFAVLATAKPAIPALSDTKGHWAEKNIQEMIQMGSINGYPDGTFKPDNNITRAEFVSIIVKAFKFKEQDGKVFADTNSHWAKNLIATAAANGIISGYRDTTFGPNDPITREQMAAIIVKAAQIEMVTEGKAYNDQLEISEWAKAAIATATSKGLMNGYQDGTLKPKGNSSRAEAVTVILRALPFRK
jgi:hypothetical protein